jgi:VCBS repeat-containing protein
MDTPMAAALTAAAPVVTVGANFAGSNFGVSGVNPPDSDGAVGPRQFVEFVNGAYSVYDKSGAVLQQLPLAQFWSSAGVTPVFPVDPRILYDPESQRWFAAAIDTAFGSGPNPTAFLLAVSSTSDPMQGWKAFEFGQTFDFTELGINRDGVYLTATNGAGGNIDLVSIPKGDLLAATPTIAHATSFQTFFANTGPAPQPAVATGLSGSEPIVGVFPDFLKISSIDSPASAPTLNISDRAAPIPEGLQNFGATQKGTTIPVNTGNLVLSSSVVMQGDKLFGVETIALNPDQTHPGLRWFEIGNPLTAPVLLDSGVISPPGLDVYYGSIAVNPLGEVVIGFSGSGPNDYPSAYAVAGKLDGDTLQLGDPILLRAGVAPETSGRFGDYSTTTYDPTDPSHFWTVQEWTSDSGWSTEISEITFSSPLPPVTRNDIAGVSKNHSVSGDVLTNDSDPNHELLTVTSVAGATINSAGQFIATGAFGTLVISSDGTFVYQADKKIDFSDHVLAQDKFTYTATNTDQLSSQATLTVTVTKPGETYIGGTPGSDANHLSVVTGGSGRQVIDGSLGFEQISGGAGADVLVGGAGDVLAGGKGADTFVFSDNFGANTITDFGGGDRIQLDQNHFQDFATVIANSASDGDGGVLISDPTHAGNTIDLLGISIASLQPNDFIFA